MGISQKRDAYFFAGSAPVKWWRRRSGLQSEIFLLGSRLWCCVALLVHLGGALDGFGDAGANIFGADVTFEVGLLHELGGLFARAAKQQGTAGFVKLIGKIFDCAQAGGVDGGHVAQSQDDNGRQGIQRIENISELVRGAEEKRAMNAEDSDVIGKVLTLQDVDAAVFDVIACD